MADDIHLDVESFSRADVTEVGSWRYWQDRSTELLCLSYAIGSGPVQQWRPTANPHAPQQKPPTALLDGIARGLPVHAHNAQFERLAYAWLRKHNPTWPKLHDRQLHCTAAQVAALSLPRALAKATDALGLPDRKDTDGKRLLNLFAGVQKNGMRVLPSDQPDEFKKLQSYCSDDVSAERGLHLAVPRLSADEQRVWQLDLAVNQRGIPIDPELVAAMRDVSRELVGDLVSRTRGLTDGLNPTQGAKLLAWAHDQGVTLPNLQANVIQNALVKRTTMPDNVREVLTMRMEAARVSVKKLDSALACMGTDHRVRGMFLYHGATTGRWAGRLVQPHNFPRGVLKPKMAELVVALVLERNIDALRLLFANPMEALSSVMRAIITAQGGKVLNVSDFAAIEARVLVWVCDQMDVLALYHGGADLYIYMASKIYRVPPQSIAKDSVERKFGKDTVLGCGYQMGVDKFIATGLKKNLLIPRELAEACVYGYRDTMKQVVKGWGKVERAAVAAVTTGKMHYACKAAFYVEGRFLFIQLPSGRRLAYPDPLIVNDNDRNKAQLSFMAQNGKTGQWERQRSYGGMIMENIVSGISRDLMAHGMLNADDDGLPVIGTVHDEVITEEDMNTADKDHLEHLLCDLPQWAHGCPVAAEGFVTKRYRKG